MALPSLVSQTFLPSSLFPCLPPSFISALCISKLQDCIKEESVSLGHIAIQTSLGIQRLLLPQRQALSCFCHSGSVRWYRQCSQRLSVQGLDKFLFKPNLCMWFLGSSVDKHNFLNITLHHLQNTLCPSGSMTLLFHNLFSGHVSIKQPQPCEATYFFFFF